MGQTLCQPAVHGAGSKQVARTSLDLELDLQASRTRQSRLNGELQTLRELRARLEAMRDGADASGAKASPQQPPPLPAAVLQDERFHSLLRQAERQVGCQPHSSACVCVCVCVCVPATTDDEEPLCVCVCE